MALRHGVVRLLRALPPTPCIRPVELERALHRRKVSLSGGEEEREGGGGGNNTEPRCEMTALFCWRMATAVSAKRWHCCGASAAPEWREEEERSEASLGALEGVFFFFLPVFTHPLQRDLVLGHCRRGACVCVHIELLLLRVLQRHGQRGSLFTERRGPSPFLQVWGHKLTAAETNKARRFVFSNRRMGL